MPGHGSWSIRRALRLIRARAVPADRQGMRLVQQRVHDASDSLIIEEEMRFDGDDGEYLWRAVDIFRLDGEMISEHTQYCTGCWAPDQIDRQAQEAPMVRW